MNPVQLLFRYNLFVLIIFPVLALAHDEPAGEPEDEGPWSGEFALGYLASDGNTDSSSLAGRVQLGYATGNWEHTTEFRGYGSSDEAGTSAENYQAWWNTLYNLTERHYLFANLEWKKNRFSGYTKQTFETAGYGYRIFNSDKLEWNVQGGAGFSQSDKVVSTDPRVTEDEDSAVFTLGTNLIWNISETSSFEQLISANSTSDNTYWETITRVKANVYGGVALAVGYTIQGNTDVEDDIEKTDRFTAVTLEYSF
jgi:putative salt-induced outer membrane protein